MKISLSLFGLGCAGLLSAASAAALTEKDVMNAVTPLVESHALQAVSVGVIGAAGPVTAHAGVFSATDPTVPDDHTIYEIGSISKVFTGLLLADAVVRGELTLDTPIARLLPVDVTLPDGAGERITLRMLSTHTSGLPRIPVEIPPDDLRDPYASYGEAELWQTLRHVTLDYPPGTKAGYSNLAAGLLGTLLARHAGMTYDALLAERITGPLQLVDTAVVLDAAQAARVAPGSNGAGEPWGAWHFQALAGAGGIHSTLADMMRFAQVLLHPEGTPLAEAIALSWAKQELAASVGPGGQGLGWMLAGDGRTRWHNGMTGGYHAAIFVSREFGVATVLLANRSSAAGSLVAEELVRQAAGIPARPTPNLNRPEVPISAEQLARCPGTYRLSPQFALVVEARDGVLVVTATGQGTDRLYAASPDTFFSRRVAADLVFEFPADGGPAVVLVLKQGGREMRAVRD